MNYCAAVAVDAAVIIRPLWVLWAVHVPKNMPAELTSAMSESCVVVVAAFGSWFCWCCWFFFRARSSQLAVQGT